MNTPFIADPQAAIVDSNIHRQASQSWLRQLLNWFENGKHPKEELQFWTAYDRQGHTVWYAYEPLTQETLVFASEVAACSWLEKRYS